MKFGTLDAVDIASCTHVIICLLNDRVLWPMISAFASPRISSRLEKDFKTFQRNTVHPDTSLRLFILIKSFKFLGSTLAPARSTTFFSLSPPCPVQLESYWQQVCCSWYFILCLLLNFTLQSVTVIYLRERARARERKLIHLFTLSMLLAALGLAKLIPRMRSNFTM